MTFALTRDFEKIQSKVYKTDKSLELRKFGKDEYILLEHSGDYVYEICSLTKEEWKTLWIMLTTKE